MRLLLYTTFHACAVGGAAYILPLNFAYTIIFLQYFAHAQSVVLPPGDWEKKNILPLNEIMELRRKRQAMKYAVLTGGAPPPPPSQVRP